MAVKSIDEIITDSYSRLNYLTVRKSELKKDIELLNIDIDDHHLVRNVLKQASLLTQNYLQDHLSSIVTKAIQSVFFEKSIEFKAQFVERRNKTECDMFVIEDGEEYDLLDDKGHGMADVASLALLVAVIVLSKNENVIIIDEPFRNLDESRKPYASLMLKELSRELDMQFIILTHIQDVLDSADRLIETKLIRRKVSGKVVKETKLIVHR